MLLISIRFRLVKSITHHRTFQLVSLPPLKVVFLADEPKAVIDATFFCAINNNSQLVSNFSAWLQHCQVQSLWIMRHTLTQGHCLWIYVSAPPSAPTTILSLLWRCRHWHRSLAATCKWSIVDKHHLCICEVGLILGGCCGKKILPARPYPLNEAET